MEIKKKIKHKWDNEFYPAHSFVDGEKQLKRLYCKRKGCGGWRDYEVKPFNEKTRLYEKTKLSEFYYETSKYCNK